VVVSERNELKRKCIFFSFKVWQGIEPGNLCCPSFIFSRSSAETAATKIIYFSK
jgi:hypothetical protein